ncbi:MAG: hypothetical protein A2066_08905 [Bacteroidetes bacterium GWB2_41_8]|nr:MAG: hypothetical protein A2066_08905 [Bacteroidetes bacterium GWB2_41_8]
MFRFIQLTNKPAMILNGLTGTICEGKVVKGLAGRVRKMQKTGLLFYFELDGIGLYPRAHKG